MRPGLLVTEHAIVYSCSRIVHEKIRAPRAIRPAQIDGSAAGIPTAARDQQRRRAARYPISDRAMAIPPAPSSGSEQPDGLSCGAARYRFPPSPSPPTDLFRIVASEIEMIGVAAAPAWPSLRCCEAVTSRQTTADPRPASGRRNRPDRPANERSRGQGRRSSIRSHKSSGAATGRS